MTRGKGLNGQLLVHYTTHTSTQLGATEYQDFLPSAGTLTFLPAVDSQVIEVNLVPDDLPEGGEEFMVNLTSVQLVNDG